MLCVTRKKRQEIFIGDDIVVAVIAIKGNSVSLGVKAPQGTPIHRREIYERIHQKEQAMSTTQAQPTVQLDFTDHPMLRSKLEHLAAVHHKSLEDLIVERLEEAVSGSVEA